VKKYILISLVVIGIFAVALFRQKTEFLIQGNTMGTTYHIKVVARYFTDMVQLKKEIEKRLDEINQSMSTFLKTSEISCFNGDTRTDYRHAVSPDFFLVMSVGKKLYQLTGGAWDGTVKPLVDLWGFGTSEQRNSVPDPQQIAAALKSVGFNQIDISKEGFLCKRNSKVTVDLASIAKGFGVDKIAGVIKSHHMTDFLVEIGGEVYASGLREDGKDWRVGINTPQPDAPFDLVYRSLALKNRAMATSGDYRNFFETNGVRYSHIIDPRTGCPVKNGVVSVSVLSDTCVFADGLATALMVMGSQDGIALTNKLKNAECLIIVRNKDGSLSDYYSESFPR
jgi:FAD:protein FMN transferase